MRSWDEILHDPRIDETGDCDYYAEDLPSDNKSWIKSECKCETCGKYHKIIQRSTHYFYCWDGWDSISYDECWVCVLKTKLHHIFRRFSRGHI